MTDNRQFAPAIERNRAPILQCLRDHLPKNGTVLELASGTGEHATYFCEHLPMLTWQPTNFDQTHLQSTEAWQQFANLPNFKPVLELDATSDIWPVETPDYPYGSIDAIFNANMIHISPWSVTSGLFKGASRVLSAGGKLILYGPYRLNGEQTSSSNVEFEKWLKAQSLEFGVRDLADVQKEAARHGLDHRKSIAMPANNFIQIFEKV